MTLYHTSPEKIEKITDDGRFGEFLFFSSTPYQMAACECVTYALDDSEIETIDATSIFYHEDAEKLDALVKEFCKRFDIDDEDLAENIISERDELDRDKYDADDSWDVQMFTARAAKILGYRGVCVTDEQGSAYMIDMLRKENELKECET